MSSANRPPNLLGKVCALKGDHNLRKLQEYMRNLGLRTQKQSYEMICSELRDYCIRNNINTEAELQLHITSRNKQTLAQAPVPVIAPLQSQAPAPVIAPLQSQAPVPVIAPLQSQAPVPVIAPLQSQAPVPPRQYTDLEILLSNDLTDFFRDTESFINLNNYTRNVRSIGVNSRNGFIRELTYVTRTNNRYKIVLKNAANSEADSLLYEYLVGLCINEFAKYFPCFPKTYMVGMYNTIGRYNTFKDIAGLQTIPNNFNTYISKLNTADLSIAVKNGCEHNRDLCVFTQFIPIEYTFHQFMGSLCEANTTKIAAMYNVRLNKLAAMLHIIYTVLSSLSNYFTHYDLHHDNVLLVKAPVGQYINIKIHLENGQIVEYKTSYMPVFIDFGHSFVDCKNLKAMLNNSDDIIKTACRYDESNPIINEAKCVRQCGDNTGYNWNPYFERATGTFRPQIADMFYIDPTRHNISHDIMFLYSISQNYNFSAVANVGYMGTSFVSNFLLNKFLPPNTQYGSRENVSGALDHVYNVHSAFTLINNIVADPQFNIDNDRLFIGQVPYKTIDIWHGQGLTHQFTS
jgi:hypothetical protein